MPPTPPLQPLKKCVLPVSTWEPVLQEGSPGTASRDCCQNALVPCMGRRPPRTVPLAQDLGALSLHRGPWGRASTSGQGRQTPAVPLRCSSGHGARGPACRAAPSLSRWWAPVSTDQNADESPQRSERHGGPSSSAGDWPGQLRKAHGSTGGLRPRAQLPRRTPKAALGAPAGPTCGGPRPRQDTQRPGPDVRQLVRDACLALHVDFRRRAAPKPGTCSWETLRSSTLQSPCSKAPPSREP